MTPDEFFMRERSLAFLMGAIPQQGNFGWGAGGKAPPQVASHGASQHTAATFRPVTVSAPVRTVSAPIVSAVHLGMPSAPTAPGVHTGMPGAPTAPGVHPGMPGAPTAPGVHTGMPGAPTAPGVVHPGMPGAPTAPGVVRPGMPGAPYIAPPTGRIAPSPSSGNYGQRHWWHRHQEEMQQAAAAAQQGGGGGGAPPPPPSQDYGQPAPYDDGSGYAQPAPPPPPGALDSSGLPAMTPYDYAAMQMPGAAPDDGSYDDSALSLTDDGSDDGSDVGFGMGLPHWAIPAAAGAAGYALYRKYRVGGFG